MPGGSWFLVIYPHLDGKGDCFRGLRSGVALAPGLGGFGVGLLLGCLVLVFPVGFLGLRFLALVVLGLGLLALVVLGLGGRGFLLRFFGLWRHLPGLGLFRPLGQRGKGQGAQSHDQRQRPGQGAAECSVLHKNPSLSGCSFPMKDRRPF